MAAWLKEDRNDVALKVILFVISPFISFLYSLRTIKSKSSYRVFFLFFLFFGLSFSVSNIRSENDSLDGVSYRQSFESYKFVSNSEFIDKFYGYISFDQGSRDFYFETIAFYLSRITSNYHLMFMVFAAVFGIFSLKSLKFLTSEKNFEASLACFILVYIFMINQIFNINGVRFWTASWIGVYCIFQIFRNGNKRYFFLALCTPFFHGSFWAFFAILLISYLSRRSYKVWVVLFFISFFVSNISVELVRGMINSLPPFIARMAESYTDAETIERRSESGTGFYWVAELFRILVRFYLNYLIWLFIKNSTIILANTKTRNLFQFLLIWMTFVNFTMPIPSLGGRFMMLAYPVIAYIWLVNFKGVRYQKVLFAMPFVFILSFYSQFRLYNMVLEPEFYFSSPFYLIYKYIIIY